MQKLTENVIHQKVRACPADLTKITQLNVTGRGLVDISLIKKLTGLEIVSFSVNNISSLACFENCKNLRALYLRQNNIKDLTEIKYLVHLPKLEILSLSQNPCTEKPLYRFTVIKYLKNLIELDDVPVSKEERREAELVCNDPIQGASSNQIISYHQDPQVRWQNGLVNEGMKTTFPTFNPNTTTDYEKIRTGGIKEDASFPINRPSQIRFSTKRHAMPGHDKGPPRFPSERLLAQNLSQCRMQQGSVVDLKDLLSSPALPVIEESAIAPNLLTAAVLMAKHLGYSELQILREEVTTMLSYLSPHYQS